MAKKIKLNLNVPHYLPPNSNVDVPHFVTYLKYTPICEWYVVKTVTPRTNNAKKTCQSD